ncbi:MAG: carboxypeptidase regulatory-like domain-containing protein, partial [Rhodospirillales bacterium]|nr:carboxypeptidase regulatory-like domain-containing protein [Rhodospirillales bacterium]
MTKKNKLVGLLAGLAVLALAPSMGQTAPKYKGGAVKDGGKITGKVSFKGAVPADAVEKILITKDPKVCGTGDRTVTWVDVKDGALRGSFVFLGKIKKGKKWGKPKGGKYLINQEKCRFHPWAQVVKPGQVTIRNSDKGVLHNINTREMIGVEKGRVVKRTMFNFGQPDPGEIQQKLKPRRSAFISINCEAHNFMFGFMMAPVHPYAAVVGDDGSYSLDNVPPGKYTVKSWHPRFGVKKSKVTVTAKGSATANFAFSAK